MNVTEQPVGTPPAVRTSYRVSTGVPMYKMGPVTSIGTAVTRPPRMTSRSV